jgi:hypothetical protein
VSSCARIPREEKLARWGERLAPFLDPIRLRTHAKND